VRLRFLTTVLMLFLALPVFAGDAFVLRAMSEQPSPIAIEISGSSVTATGLTPGGAVAVVAAWNTTVRGWSKAGHTWQDARAAANGAVQTTFPNLIPPGAFLAVIDVATGRVVEKTDAVQTFQRLELPEKRLKRDSKREVGEIWSPLPRAMIVWIRAGEGVWVQVAGDGGSGDDDLVTNGRVSTDPGKMNPIAFSPAPPKKIKSHDIVLMIDVRGGLIASTEVAQ
jgi:hypothetical protein